MPGRNVVGGNAIGIDLQSTGNTVRNNYVGTADGGSSPIANGNGVRLIGSSNTVGGASAGEGNLLSGNSQSGLQVNFSGPVAQRQSGATRSASTPPRGRRCPTAAGITIQSEQPEHHRRDGRD